jgi:SPP1 gp7 family putative phage head morphogenesis protein
MPDNPILDANTSHAIYIERLGAANANKLDPELKKLASYVRSRIGEEGATLGSQKDINALVRDVKAKFAKAYERWTRETFDFVDELAGYEAGFQSNIIEASTDGYQVKEPNAEKARRKVFNTAMMIGTGGAAVSVNALLGNFTKTQSDAVGDIIRSGSDGRPTTDVIAAITGTKKNGYSDGLMARAKRSATTISKTAANHTSEQAKQVVYKDNDKAVIGYKIIAVLDGKTSQTCRGLDGTEVRFNDSYQPHPPFHRNCRTTEGPLLNPELAAISTEARSNDMPKGSEFQSTASQYYTRMKTQPAWYQDDVLGKTQGKIFRNAGLTPEEFRKVTITRTGEPLNLKQMAQKDGRIKAYLASLK